MHTGQYPEFVLFVCWEKLRLDNFVLRSTDLQLPALSQNGPTKLMVQIFGGQSRVPQNRSSLILRMLRIRGKSRGFQKQNCTNTQSTTAFLLLARVIFSHSRQNSLQSEVVDIVFTFLDMEISGLDPKVNLNGTVIIL